MRWWNWGGIDNGGCDVDIYTIYYYMYTLHIMNVVRRYRYIPCGVNSGVCGVLVVHGMNEFEIFCCMMIMMVKA